MKMFSYNGIRTGSLRLFAARRRDSLVEIASAVRT
jgi:hypothetical protein